MNLTQSSLANRAVVGVTLALVAAAGIVCLLKLPIQLLPPIDQPTINIFNNWRGAAPEDMEAVIIEQQERVLQGIPGVQRISSGIRQGNGNILLTFEIGSDMQRAYLDVINRLQQVPPMPRDANGPWVNLGGDNFTSGNAASLLVRSMDPDDARDPADFQQVVTDHVFPRLSRIPGVANVNMNSQRPEEVRVTLDAARAAGLGIQISEIVAALNSATDVSGGFADVGRRQYTVRFLGKAPLNELEQLIVAQRNGRSIYLSDIAQVDVQRIDVTGYTLRNGFPAYYITLQAESGANTVTVLDGVNAAIDDLNAGPLPESGLSIELSYDASVHIRRAILLVQSNILLGAMLATLVLFAFLRSWRSTLLVALTIPVSLLVAFIAIRVFGRSLNVISLAGLAFAVGLVLDAAIIVQENIVRLRQSGVRGMDAVLRGANDVAPALFASTVTSIAIFVPILFMKGPEGQLFSDLALTLSIAVVTAFITALTVLPVASATWLNHTVPNDRFAGVWDRLTHGVMHSTRPPALRMAWIVALTLGAGALGWALMPKADYLPHAPTENLWVNFSAPPGASVESTRTDIADVVVARTAPYLSGEKSPKVAYYNLSTWGRSWFGMAIYPENPADRDALQAVLRDEITAGLPDTRAFVSGGSLLNFGGGSNRQIDMDLSGADLGKLLAAAQIGLDKIRAAMPGVPARPRPDLELAEPELHVLPDDYRIGQAGLTRATVGNAVRAYTDGIYVGEYFDGNQRLNVILRGPGWDTPEGLIDTPLHTPGAGIQRLGDLARIQRTVGPSELRRVDGRRTVTLRVFPPETLALEDAIDTLKREVEPAVLAALVNGSVRYRGSADGLDEALAQMARNLLYAMVILVLLLSAQYRSVADALIVVSVMPLAFGGGVTALWLLNLFSYQSMDLLTMSGFIILLGLVVNNAILLVDRTRAAEREGATRPNAVRQAVRQRTRPILISTLTSVFGMLPLMLMPGTGSEIYRGLATIIVGGMVLSMLFTLLLLPSLLRFGRARAAAGTTHASGTPA